jgi:hypothetical protein
MADDPIKRKNPQLWFRYHLTWKDDAPVVERGFFKVTGCP